MTIAKYELLKKLSAAKPGAGGTDVKPTPIKSDLVSPTVVSPNGAAPQVMTKQVRGTSYAQVALKVTPQVVTPGASGLKPDFGQSVEHFGSQSVRRGRRPNPLTVRLSDQELTIVRGKAEAACCTLNGYARAALLGSDYKPKLHPDLREQFLALNLELTRQGTNLNQIAKHLNSYPAATASGEAMMDTIRRSMLRTHFMVRKALSHGHME